MKNPKVSIIIPVYNGEMYIKEAIDSALAQTYKNIEVIVVNDGSSDKTDEICKSYGSKIRYFKKENGGVSTALNLGIKKMNGEYFSWLSHDDLYLPNKIKEQINYLNKIEKYDVILYSDYSCINKDGNIIGEPVILDSDMLLKKPIYSLLRGCINGITMLIPKKCFYDCGFFDDNLRCTQDYALWFKMIKKYEFIHMKGINTLTRLHSLQTTNVSDKMLSEGNKLYIDMINDIGDNEKIKLEGSLYDFYYKEAEFLNTTPYNDAKVYCIDKCILIDKNLYSKKPIKAPKNGIKKVIQYIKDYGIIYTGKRVFRKLFK